MNEKDKRRLAHRMASRVRENEEKVDYDDRKVVVLLLSNIRTRMPELCALWDKVNGHWNYEDVIYRFYHHSFKVYAIQGLTLEMKKLFESLLPDYELHEWFIKIVETGTGKQFEMAHNQVWLEVTRPMIEAFFHARYFLEMMIRYGEKLEKPPLMLPSGWAAVLYLYNLR